MSAARELERWIEDDSVRLKHSTEIVTRNLIKKHLIPFFGDRDLREITNEDVRAFATQKILEEQKSPKTVENALGVLRLAMTQLGIKGSRGYEVQTDGEGDRGSFSRGGRRRRRSG